MSATVRPIIFSAPMVRALRAGRKTQTRRIIKPQPTMHPQGDCSIKGHRGPVDYLMREIAPRYWARYRPGDLLWVREAHYLTDDGDYETAVYAADDDAVRKHLADISDIAARYRLPAELAQRHSRRRPSIHMPRWASRITLEVEAIRVERLQGISEEDARAEGVKSLPGLPGRWRNYLNADQDLCANTAGASFYSLWVSLHGAGAWDANPWIVALTFRVHRCNVDQLANR